MRKKQARIVLTDLAITGYAAEGKALAKTEGKVVFVSGAVPGDRADILITKNKKDWAEGRVLEIKEFSPDRVDPFCRHFGTCGGCKWQMLPYQKQLAYKQQEAIENLQRIGKTAIGEILPVVGADDDRYYRNKLEFTFSNKSYIPSGEMKDHGEDAGIPKPALGFHAPRIFDKAIDIEECFLMDGINNRVRNSIRSFCLEQGYTFYDARSHTGWLRNIIIRYCTTGECMLNIVFNNEDEEERKKLLDFILPRIPVITTLLYTINPKWNDSIYDLQPQVYSGPGYIMEKLEDLLFKISPKSFFQTNTRQAEKLYSIAREFAGLTGKEIVYDLYCGTGSIGLFVSRMAQKVIGVEVVAEAVEDAIQNAALNHIGHAHFFAGDVIRVCNEAFFTEHGRPDVIITDPPRAGMHEKLVQKLLEIEAPTIVYVSCNTATQARDIALLSEKYEVKKIQAVDMFPHTHHIECVAQLKLK